MTMLIEVKKDIIDAAVSNGDKISNFELRVLKELAIAVQKGRHIVYVPCLEDSEYRGKICRVISQYEMQLLRKSQRNRLDFHVLCSMLRTKLVCTNEIEYQDPNFEHVIVINPCRYVNFDFFEETHVIGEHLRDVDMFNLMRDYYAYVQHVTNVRSAYVSVLGGGLTTRDVVKYEISNIRHLCLIISDSDKHYKGATLGHTALCIKELLDRNDSFNCYFLSMNDVMEIENLIPKHVVALLPNQSIQQKMVLKHNTSFYDMKKGLCCCAVYSKESMAYWKKVFPDRSFEEEENKIRKVVSHAQCKKNYPIPFLPGWGDDMLAKIWENENCHKKLMNFDGLVLTDEQKTEWMRIGRCMFEWTCSLQPIYVG